MTSLRHSDMINPPCDITMSDGYVTLPLHDGTSSYIIENNYV